MRDYVHMATSLYILHGWSVSDQNQEKWRPFQAALQQSGVQSVFLPIPGLSAPLDAVWELDDFVRWLHDELPDEPVVLLGHSFGGQIAVRFAATYPERVAKLVLIDSAGIRDHRLVPTIKRVAFLGLAKVGKVFFTAGLGRFARSLLYRAAQEKDYATAPPLLRRTMSKVLDDEIIRDLPKVSCETLLIWGKLDKVTPLFLAKQFQALLPSSRLAVIAHARHSPQFTHTAETAQFVTAFVRGEKK